MKSTLVRWGAVALMIGTLAGCGGGGGGTTTAAAPAGGGGGGGGGGTTPTVAVPTGTAPITLTAATPAATFAALAPVVTVGGVTINSPPCVSFSVADASNNGIIGLGSTTKKATDTVASYGNLSFTLAKLVPGTNGAPSKWVNYLQTTVPTLNADGTTKASVPAANTTDNAGTLTDNKNGTYQYCFYRDVKAIAAQVAAATLTAPQVAADLGDLTYDPNAVHRMLIRISGNAPGTGTNTPTGVQTTPGVPMTHPVNIAYDFIPATGKAAGATDPSRVIVDVASCNACHDKLGGIPGAPDVGFHGGNMYDPKACVVCHTDQRKFGKTSTASTNNGTTISFPAITRDATGKITSASFSVADGDVLADFPRMIHKIHMGEGLVKQNYNFDGVLLNDVKYPQDIRNCTTCHDGSANAAHPTPQGDNWMNVPSRLACGACHDGINFATGKGVTLADAAKGLTTSTYGHVGGSQSDDSACHLCHKPADIATYHIPVTPPDPNNALNTLGGNTHSYSESIDANQSNLPAGANKVSWDLQSVSVDANKHPVMVFRFLQNGARADFNDPTKATEIWTNYIGSPSLYFVWAEPQDGVTAPADFNASASSWFKNLWNGKATGTGAGTLAGPDANGYYTATLTGTTIDASAVMLTGGIGYTYGSGSQPLTQTNVSGYPTSVAPQDATKFVGGLAVVAPNVSKVATGYAGRRAIVEAARCNNCHKNLGVFTREAFHAGQRNDGASCAWCHNPNRTNSGWSVDSEYFIHAIHGASKRTQAFTYNAASVTDNFSTIGYPGILKNCQTCHLPGTYDFSASASASALPNRLFRTVATGTTAAAGISTSPYIAQAAGTVYGSGFSYNAGTNARTEAAGTTLVISPIMTVCVSCHDGVNSATGIDAKTHMQQNGGSFYVARNTLYKTGSTTALQNNETCMLCHVTGGVADIKAMHAK